MNSSQELHLGNNNLQTISVEHLESLQNVSVLDLRDNRIARIPEEIVLLRQLERLDLTNNDLSMCVPHHPPVHSVGSSLIEGMLQFAVQTGNNHDFEVDHLGWQPTEEHSPGYHHGLSRKFPIEVFCPKQTPVDGVLERNA